MFFFASWEVQAVADANNSASFNVRLSSPFCLCNDVVLAVYLVSGSFLVSGTPG